MADSKTPMKQESNDSKPQSSPEGEQITYKPDAQTYTSEVDSLNSLGANIGNESGSSEGHGIAYSPEQGSESGSRMPFRKQLLMNIANPRLSGKKKWLALGLGGAGLLTGVFALFGILGIFKMDFFLQNIDSAAFARYNNIFEGRSRAWTEAYIRMRITEFDDPNGTIKLASGNRESAYFRANRVTSRNPTTDWYRTLRASSFEADLFEKHGIRFTSNVEYNPNGSLNRIVFSRLEINGDTRIQLEDIDASDFRSGRIDDLLSEVDDLVRTRFDTDTDMRRAIREAVNDNTHWSRFIRRWTLRRSIQNMTGTRSWRVFDGTRFESQRDAFELYRRRLQIKVIENTLGSFDNTKYIACMFGASSCPKTTVPSDTDNIATGSPDGARVNDVADPDNPDGLKIDETTGEQISQSSDSDRVNSYKQAVNDAIAEQKKLLSPNADDSLAKKGFKKILTSKIFTKMIPLIGVIDLVDTIAFMDKALQDGSLSKAIELSRTQQYISTYATFGSIRDQVVMGEDIVTEDVNAVLELFEHAQSSEAYTTLIENGAVDPQLKEQACSDDNYRYSDIKEYHYICDDQKITGGTRGERLEAAYQDGPGRLIGPLASGYRAVAGIPGIAQILQISRDALNAIGDFALTTFLTVTTLEDEYDATMAAAMGELTEWVGLSPVIDGTEQGGELLSAIAIGSAASAETAVNYNGGGLATPEINNYFDKRITQQLNENKQHQSVFDRYFSFNNKDSLVASALGASSSNFSELSEDVIASINPLNSAQSIAQSVNYLSSDVVYAQSANTSRKVRELTGVRTYGFSPSVYEQDVLINDPKQCTNLDDSGFFTDVQLDWETVSSPARFSDITYSLIDDRIPDNRAQSVAEQIYNICLLDQAIRDGFISQYDSRFDNGFNSETYIQSFGSGDAESILSNTGVVSPPEYGNGGNPTPDGYYFMPEAPNGEYILKRTSLGFCHSGTKRTVDTLYTVALRWHALHPNNPLEIYDLNNALRHLSHGNGLDADVTVNKGTGIWTYPRYSGYPQETRSFQTPFPPNPNYEPAQAWELAQLFFNTGNVTRILYNDREVSVRDPRIVRIINHWDHFHVDFKGPKGPSTLRCE